MSENFYYPSRDHLVRIHNYIMGITDQENKGMYPYKDIKKTTDFVKNDDYYPDVISKLSYYIFSILKNHYFFDGNKRVALGAIKAFMILNRVTYDVDKFENTIEHVIMMTADNNVVDEDYLQAYFQMILSGFPDETVSFKIYKYTTNFQK